MLANASEYMPSAKAAMRSETTAAAAGKSYSYLQVIHLTSAKSLEMLMIFNDDVLRLNGAHLCSSAKNDANELVGHRSTECAGGCLRLQNACRFLQHSRRSIRAREDTDTSKLWSAASTMGDPALRQ